MYDNVIMQDDTYSSLFYSPVLHALCTTIIGINPKPNPY